MKEGEYVYLLQLITLILLIVIIYYGSVAFTQFQTVETTLTQELTSFKSSIEEVKLSLRFELGVILGEVEKGIRGVREEVEKIRVESKEGMEEVIEVLKGLNDTNNQLKERIGRTPY